jgi:hypothetical protein
MRSKLIRATNHQLSGGLNSVKEKAPVVKQLYRLNVEPRVVDQLTKLASRTGEPKTRIATRLFTDAVMGFKPPPKTSLAKTKASPPKA